MYFCIIFQLATSVTELVHVLSPLVQQAQELTESVSEHLHLTTILADVIKNHEAVQSQSLQHQNTPADGVTHPTKSAEN